MLRRAAPSVLVLALVAACIPDPKGDFDDFVDRTAEDRAKEPTVPEGGAGIDAAPPTEAVEGLYYGACLSALSSGDTVRVLRFYTKTKFTPGASAGGTLDLELFPLKAWDKANNDVLPVEQSKVAESEIRGKAVTAKAMAVDGAGKFVAELGTITMPGEANPITGRDIVIEKVVLRGIFGDGPRFCSSLEGQITSPINQPLLAKDNICIFAKAKDGDPATLFQRTEFVCQ